MDKRILYAAMLRLKSSPEFAPIREYLDGILDECRDSLVTLTNMDYVKVVQGKAQALKEFLDLVERSDKLLDQLNGR